MIKHLKKNIQKKHKKNVFLRKIYQKKMSFYQ